MRRGVVQSSMLTRDCWKVSSGVDRFRQHCSNCSSRGGAIPDLSQVPFR